MLRKAGKGSIFKIYELQQGFLKRPRKESTESMERAPEPLDMQYLQSQDFKIPEPPHKVPISAMFLCQFDVKRGNIIVWSKTCNNSEISLKNIEFKCLPSGSHESTEDIINFVLPKGSSHYLYGVAAFEQNGQDLIKHNTQVDRSKVYMFSLGIVVDPQFRQKGVSRSKFYDWKPNRFTSANEYIDDLQALLKHWLRIGNFSDFETFEDYFDSNSLKSESARLSSPVLQRSWQNAGKFIGENVESRKHRHMLEKLPELVRSLGPLLFSLWKSCLLRERVLILNSAELSFEKCNALTYCLSILSLVPKVLQNSMDFKEETLQPLYTVGITDIDYLTSLVSESMTTSADDYDIPGFIACTSDEILLFKNELYDKCLKLKDDGKNIPEFVTASDSSVLRATPHEWELYRKLVHVYLGEELSETRCVTFSSSIEPLSWSQYLIDGFYWWATAGYIKPSYHENEDLDEKEISDELDSVLGLVGYFHQRTCIILNRLNHIIETYDTDNDTVIISPHVLIEIGLDCFSSQDYEFVEKLSLRWFKKRVIVKQVDVKVLC